MAELGLSWFPVSFSDSSAVKLVGSWSADTHFIQLFICPPFRQHRAIDIEDDRYEYKIMEGSRVSKS